MGIRLFCRTLERLGEHQRRGAIASILVGQNGEGKGIVMDVMEVLNESQISNESQFNNESQILNESIKSKESIKSNKSKSDELDIMYLKRYISLITLMLNGGFKVLGIVIHQQDTKESIEKCVIFSNLVSIFTENFICSIFPNLDWKEISFVVDVKGKKSFHVKNASVKVIEKSGDLNLKKQKTKGKDEFLLKNESVQIKMKFLDETLITKSDQFVFCALPTRFQFVFVRMMLSCSTLNRNSSTNNVPDSVANFDLFRDYIEPNSRLANNNVIEGDILACIQSFPTKYGKDEALQCELGRLRKTIRNLQMNSDENEIFSRWSLPSENGVIFSDIKAQGETMKVFLFLESCSMQDVKDRFLTLLQIQDTQRLLGEDKQPDSDEQYKFEEVDEYFASTGADESDFEVEAGVDSNIVNNSKVTRHDLFSFWMLPLLSLLAALFLLLVALIVAQS